MHHLTWKEEGKKHAAKNPSARLAQEKDGSAKSLANQDGFKKPEVPFQGAPGSGADEVSVSWLLTAEDKCALDVKGFAAIDEEITQRTRDVVLTKYADQPQGKQAATTLLGDEWAQKNLPDTPNEPSILLPPFLTERDREMLLQEVRESLEQRLDDLEGQQEYAKSVEEIMKRCMLEQFRNSAEDVEGQDHLRQQVRESVGASLASVWAAQPRIQERHVRMLKGTSLPGPLRAHLWMQRLGGGESLQKYSGQLDRKMKKRGVGVDSVEDSELSGAILRAATDLYSTSPALVSIADSGSISHSIAVLVRVYVLTGQRTRLDRSVLLLAPFLHLYPALHPTDADYCRWLTLLMEMESNLPHIADVPDHARNVLQRVKGSRASFFDHLTALHQKHTASNPTGASEGALGVASLVEGWLLTGLVCCLSSQSLFWWWDQCFILGWDGLEGACGRLLLKLEVDLMRCSTWDMAVRVVNEQPAKLATARLKDCFADCE